MNLDFALVNRALLNIGVAPLTDADKEAENEAWLTAKEYFLATMLESLAQVEWTGAKRRRELAPAQMPYKGNSDFAYSYALPIDCAKPIELDGQEYFEAEANLLFADAAPARLLYVSNGKRLIDQGGVRNIDPLKNQPALSAGGAGRRLARDYITGGDARRERRYEWGDNIVLGGGAGRGNDDSFTMPLPPEAGEDYPEYGELRLEPNFYLYWENLLSSKFALRLTDKPDLSMVFFNKAMAIGGAAEAISIAGGAARRKAPPSWQEQLGLS